jgi:pimeloyl-ACP methyl ester carboxylesterase
VLAVAEDDGNVVGLVGHSLGAAACVLAMRERLRVRAAVLLAPLSDPEKTRAVSGASAECLARSASR